MAEKDSRSLFLFLIIFLLSAFVCSSAHAQELIKPAGREKKSKLSRMKRDIEKLRAGGEEDWHYGAYVDVGYLWNFNFPDSKDWRSKTTTFKLNSPEVNMAMAYVRKDVSPSDSRWGGEFGLQTGVDTEGLVPGPLPRDAAPIDAADTLRHFYRANGSYLFPVGNGLKVTAGLFNGYIGYSSFHAKDNANYTRGYILDHVPYFSFGGAAVYPAGESLTLGFYIVNGWSYLATPNDVPSYGLQAVWELSPKLTFVQNVYWGAEQENTDLRFWRLFSDSIVEWRSERWSLAAAYDIGTEDQAAAPDNPRFIWMSGAVWGRWHVRGPWSLGLRPEFYWDPDGLITGSTQLIGAVTATMEYRISVFESHTGIWKLEYRFDRSTGSGGGFFTGNELSPGGPELTSNQQLLILSLMWAFDA